MTLQFLRDATDGLFKAIKWIYDAAVTRIAYTNGPGDDSMLSEAF